LLLGRWDLIWISHGILVLGSFQQNTVVVEREGMDGACSFPIWPVPALQSATRDAIGMGRGVGIGNNLLRRQ
jgi:hypothetical protein